MRPRLVADGQPVELGDLAPDRDAEVLTVPELGVRMAGEDVGGEPGAQPVGQPRPWVRLVHHDGNPAPPGGQVGGGGDVPAEADEHLRPGPVEHAGRRVDRPRQPAGHRQQLGRHRPGHRHGRDELERVSAQGDQPGLQAAFGTQAGHFHVRVGPSQGVRQRESWFDMSGGPAAGKQYPHVSSLNCSRAIVGALLDRASLERAAASRGHVRPKPPGHPARAWRTTSACRARPGYSAVTTAPPRRGAAGRR